MFLVVIFHALLPRWVYQCRRSVRFPKIVSKPDLVGIKSISSSLYDQSIELIDKNRFQQLRTVEV